MLYIYAIFMAFFAREAAQVPRKRNQLGTVSLTISTTQPVVAYLEALVESGLYGKNPAEAAERLIATALEELIRSGTLARHATSGLRPEGAV
jgi:hypothetical protein